MAPQFGHLTPLRKIEVLENTLENTQGSDLYRILWVESKNSEVQHGWLDWVGSEQRRGRMTMAVMVFSCGCVVG